MASREILSLDTATPQIVAPQTGDTYSAPRAVAISPESLTGTSATTSLDIAQTWNTTGTPTAIKMNVTDTASNANSLLMDLGTGGGTFASKFSVAKSGFITFAGHRMYSDAGAICFTNNSNVTTLISRTDYTLVPQAASIGWGNLTSFASDLSLYRDNAANTLGQRNATNAQTFNIYNTYTTTTNYERGFLKWNTNVLQIGTEKGSGGGTARALEFQTDGTTRATISATGEVNVAGALRIGTDANKGLITYTTNAISFNPAGAAWFGIGNNIVDFSVWTISGVTIGSTGNESGISNRGGTPIVIRPRGGSGNGAGSYVSLFNSLPTVSGTTGHTQELTIQTWLPATGAAGIQFGGTTSSFPALKRSATTLQVRLADDSAFGPLEASTLTTSNAYTVATLPAAGVAGRRAYVTDATTPTFLGALTGGGAVVCPVFDNGTAWVAG